MEKERLAMDRIHLKKQLIEAKKERQKLQKKFKAIEAENWDLCHEISKYQDLDKQRNATE